MKRKGKPRPQGEIRQSQIITTFGPGAMVDLPDHSVLIGGLEMWEGADKPVFEERLTTKLATIFNVPAIRLFEPPIDLKDPLAPRSGITAWKFPEWFIGQYEDSRLRSDAVRSRPLVHRENLIDDKYYLGPDRKKYQVVPVRFVQACVNGHISDINWYAFVHGLNEPCRRPLWVDERGTSGDLRDIIIRCECEKSKAIYAATQIGDRILGFCKGNCLWLGPKVREKCGGENGTPEINRLLVRSASNAYFPQVLSVISIPDPDLRVNKAVNPVWEDFLQYVETIDDLQRERKRAKVFAALEGLTDEAILEEIQRRKGGGTGSGKKIKQSELEMLLSSPDEIGEDVPGDDFYARAFPLKKTESPILSSIERVVLVHRLREVMVQLGFTRFESAVPDIDGELALDVRRASLAREISWLPAVENRGEGIFIALKADRIREWAAQPSVQARGRQLMEGFKAWEKNHPGSTAIFPGVRYILLHSLSHLLITAVSLECGYAASSIRERVYMNDAGCGILLYTASSDAEGTLGGLVQIGRRIESHLEQGLDLGRLCSNDPVCAQHRPNNAQEERFLHGAACHGCLLIAETSCEFRNDFLDRALVVPTVENLGAEFFAEV
jgi:hypothetical protein